jgi:lipid-binding SYLF domain-containing protein
MLRSLMLAALAALAFSSSPVKADNYYNAANIASDSQRTLEALIKDTELGPTVKNLMNNAKGVMIFPDIIKAALFIGGEGGSGVLMAKQPNGAWSYPAFYTMGSISFGFQAGGQSQQSVLIIMTQAGLDAILNEQVKIGADISASAGPRGVGAETATTAAGGKDVFVYSLNQGLFVGASVEGAIIAKRSDWNQAYYGQATTPRQIVQENAVSNPNADPLRAAAELIR